MALFLPTSTCMYTHWYLKIIGSLFKIVLKDITYHGGFWLISPPLCVLPQVPKVQPVALITSPEDSQHYEEARQCVEELALYLKPLSNTRGTHTQHNLILLLKNMPITLLAKDEL